MRIIACLLAFIACLPCRADLTAEQKIADLVQLASLYGKNYGPYEWKRVAFNFDALDLRPWVERARQTRNDLEFIDLCFEYLSKMDDAHVSYTFPSSFSASLGFSVDIYDGKVLIDGLNRTLLPAARYPFQIGDEVVSVDGRPVEDLIREFSRYSIAANPLSTRRSASARIPIRAQSRVPFAHMIGDTAAVEIRQAVGGTNTYDIPWQKSGTPVTTVGIIPSPLLGIERSRASHEDPMDYMRPLRLLDNASIDADQHAVLGIGARAPIFRLPAGFQIRQGQAATDFYYSGTFQADGLRIGFIRIPSYSPPNTALQIQQFRDEMIFFEQNTDGLVIDDMRNPGGSVNYVQALAQLVHTGPFRLLGFELRATANWHASFSSSLAAARAQNAPAWTIAMFAAYLSDIEKALRENRANTGPLPLGSVTVDVSPSPGAYSKPLIVLVDEFSASAADMFPAIVQDNGRGLIFGNRTMGADGNVVAYDGGNYTEIFTRVTQSLMSRKNPIVTPEYPTAPYVENIGVRPEIVEDYMTRDNLINGGATFVQRFTAAIVEHIRRTGR